MSARVGRGRGLLLERWWARGDGCRRPYTWRDRFPRGSFRSVATGPFSSCSVRPVANIEREYVHRVARQARCVHPTVYLTIDVLEEMPEPLYLNGIVYTVQ